MDNWYLADGPDVFPAKRTRPIVEGLPTGFKGSQPTDGKHLLITPEQMPDVEADPIAAKYARRFMQTTEFLYGEQRWCLWLVEATPPDLAASPVLRSRLRLVSQSRLESDTPSVRIQAPTPSLFTQIRQPTHRFLALPEGSSANRRVIPGHSSTPTTSSPEINFITFPGADNWLFGMLHSAMFLAWVRTISGRMKSDISIAPGLVYFTFPFPDAAAAKATQVTGAAEAV